MSTLEPLLPDGKKPLAKVKSCTLASRRSLMEEAQGDKEQKPSVVASIVTLILTLPALLGTCCWPVLIAGFIGISATAEAKVFSHTFSLAVTAVVLTNLSQFVWSKAASKSGDLTHWQRYGPTYLLALATPLILADQVIFTSDILGILKNSRTVLLIRSAMLSKMQTSGPSQGVVCIRMTVMQPGQIGVSLQSDGFSLLPAPTRGSASWSWPFCGKLDSSPRSRGPGTARTVGAMWSEWAMGSVCSLVLLFRCGISSCFQFSSDDSRRRCSGLSRFYNTSNLIGPMCPRTMLLVLASLASQAFANSLQLEKPSQLSDRVFITCGKIIQERADAFPKGW